MVKQRGPVVMLSSRLSVRAEFESPPLRTFLLYYFLYLIDTNGLAQQGNLYGRGAEAELHLAKSEI